MTDMIATLRAARPDPERLGGKGANLARLSSAGFPLPFGFVVTTAAYRAFITAHHLDDWLEELARAESSDAMDAIVRERFAHARLPEDMAPSIRDAYAKMGRPPVAVRSSATAEDLAGLSFAGQYESFLNVSGDAEVLERVVACWASLWTARCHRLSPHARACACLSRSDGTLIRRFLVRLASTMSPLPVRMTSSSVGALLVFTVVLARLL